MSEHGKQAVCTCCDDKTRWGDGPWQEEPNRSEFSHAGLRCITHRSSGSGAWCGYVGVPPGHPLHNVNYSSPSPALLAAMERRKQQPLGEDPGIPLLLKSIFGGDIEPTPDQVLNVHGGITYSDSCGGCVCHVAAPGEPDNLWWFGFDCSHCDDLAPKILATMRSINAELARDRGHYWTAEEAKAETMKLAEQLAAIGAESCKV